ncbi:prevent-host-death protein [Bacteroides fragilis]|nr:prevent-host-death protein [Bacteroides fragilis]
MQVIPLSKFRTNQTATLLRAIQGESVFLTSRIGDFKLVPVSVEEKIATRIREGLNEVKRIEAGEQPARSANAFLMSFEVKTTPPHFEREGKSLEKV